MSLTIDHDLLLFGDEVWSKRSVFGGDAYDVVEEETVGYFHEFLKLEDQVISDCRVESVRGDGSIAVNVCKSAAEV